MVTKLSWQTGSLGLTQLHQLSSRQYDILDLALRSHDYEGVADTCFSIMAINGQGSLQSVWPDDTQDPWFTWVTTDPFGHVGSGILKNIAKWANLRSLELRDIRLRYIPIAEKTVRSISNLSPPKTAEDIWRENTADLISWLDSGTKFRPPKA